MKEAKSPFVVHNAVSAALMGAVQVGYIWWIQQLTSGIQEAKRNGGYAELAGVVIIIPYILTLYTLPFTISAVAAALKRGSSPVSYWTIFGGLLPTLVLWLLSLIVLYHRMQRVG